jgi:hypothetical protein
MQNNITLSKKSGKGLSHGVLSEMSVFFHVMPGHAEQLYAAIQRFGVAAREAVVKAGRSGGLRDTRFVIFDHGQRLLWATSFETDWDAYIDDSVVILGQDMFIDWMQHTVEATNRYPEGIKAVSSTEVKQFAQSAQAQAAYYEDVFSGYTISELKKAGQVAQAFQQVLDNPEAAQALQHPALKPLLEQAAD